MVTSGLVSLNVHEALNFDGTPICLHPDLFSQVSTDMPSYHSGATTIVAGNRMGSSSSAAAKGLQLLQQQQQQQLPLSSTMSSDAAPSMLSENKGLQVGDMLEIRVWDPLPKTQNEASTSSNISSIMRQRSQQQGNTTNVSAASSTSSAPANTAAAALDTALAEVAPTHQRTRSASNANSSMQYSDSSVVDIMELEDVGKQELTVDNSSTGSSGDPSSTLLPPPSQISPILPTKSIVAVSSATATMAAPRLGRANLAENAAAGVRNSSGNNNNNNPVVTKPPLQRRTAAVSQQQPQPLDTTTAKQQQPPRQLSSNKPATARHVRDLSDMTADTVYGTTALDSSQQLVDFHLPSGAVASGDDDEDNMWMSSLLHTHRLRLSFVMLVTEKTLTSLKGSARTQVSILRQVADLYHLSSYDMVSIHKVTKDEEEAALHAVSADFLLVTIKDQFISRGDMLFFQKSLIGSWVYEGQRLYEATRGLQANAREIRHSKQQALSGIVTDTTVITFRSRSSRIIWLVQISSEMWDYGTPYERGLEESICEIYFDKWIAFVHKLFVKWKELEATHSLTVVFFSRSFLSSKPTVEVAGQHDVYGRRFEDHFRIVLENETGPDWDSLVVRIKEAFVRYPSEVGWTLSSGDNVRRPSTASHGNVLEAINVTLNLLQFHYLDRDLQRTGNSIVVVSAGNGVFEVDKGLAGISYQRMMDNGIGSDVLSLGLPTLHIAPFFLYSNSYQAAGEEDAATQGQYYEVPHWMHLSFVSYESDEAVFIEHLYEAEEKKRYRKLVANQSDLDIVANGFLLSSDRDSVNDAETQSSSKLRRTSFTASGNAAASPLKEPRAGSSERQLIDGRDFRDILEACRPRFAGAIPSALKALLQINDSKRNTVGVNTGDGSSLDNLEEWGTVDFDLFKGDSSARIGRRTLSLGQDPDERSNPRQFSRSPQHNIASLHSSTYDDEIDQGLDRSQASSFASAILGMSYDRPSHHTLHASPTATAVQLQRSASLRISSTEDDESGIFFTNETTGMSSDEDDAKYSCTKVSDSNYVERLRIMMRNHDANMMNMPSPKLSAKAEPSRSELENVSGQGSRRVTFTQNKPQSGAVVKHRLLHGSQGMSAGGLGAALTQYIPTSSTFVSDAERGSSTLGRTTSMIGLSGSTGQISFRRMVDMGSRGISPLLLPPIASTLPDFPDHVQDGAPPEQIPFERRFVNPQSYSTGRSAGVGTSSRIGDMRSDAQKRDGLQSHDSRSLSVSPPTSRRFGSPSKDKAARHQSINDLHSSGKTRHRVSTSPSRAGVASRRRKVFNPFRQQDEEEVLAMKSHNRRRWSHVFPLGEVEFKRHAGPNWKSLTAPAILPLSIDYFPKQEEIDHKFTFSSYNVTLSEFEHTNYSSNKDLLDEMVRQRLTQDFQLVSEDCINANNYRRETRRDGRTHARLAAVDEDDSSETIRQFLSMGHRLHAITYDPSADLIEVYRYDDKETQKNFTFDYQYFSYCQENQSYSKARQTFSKYSAQYNWNKVDNIICGDDDREMREGMRFKRIMFGIVPENFHGDLGAEEAYAAKFRRFLEYLEKLRDKDESSRTPLDIKFVTSVDKQYQEESKRMESTPGVERDSMIRFYIQLRKGKRDNLEWMEVALDSTFDTSWSYRIMFNWLVASSGKVDTQVQLLQRRCTQFGLELVPFPQITVSRNTFLNPFKAPAILAIRYNIDLLRLYSALSQIDFVHDGVFSTDTEAILECMDGSDDFGFQKQRGIPATGKKFIPAMGKQFVHRSGTLFVRVLTDLNGFVILVVLGNYRHMLTNKDETVVQAYQSAYKALTKCIASLEKEEKRKPAPLETTLEPFTTPEETLEALQETIEPERVVTLQQDVKEISADSPKEAAGTTEKSEATST